MNVHLFPFIPAYGKNFNSQNVLSRLLEECREHLENNKTMGGILMDLSKAFECFIKNSNMHNFAHDNTLTTFAQNV